MRTSKILSACSVLLCLLSRTVTSQPALPQAEVASNALPELAVFQFTSGEEKVLPGNSTEKGTAFNCSGKLGQADTLGNIAIVSQLYQNGCYTDGAYNHKDFRVEQGVFSRSGGGKSFDAYRVFEPSQKAKKFLGSRHVISYKSASDFDVYSVDGSSVRRLASVTGGESGHVKIPELVASDIKGSMLLVFVPSSEKISPFSTIASGVEGARLQSSSIGIVSKYRYALKTTPPDIRTDFPGGPNTWDNVYGCTRQFFPIKSGSSLGAVVWQDSTGKVNLTTFSGLKSAKTISVTTQPNSELAAASGAENFASSGFYYLLIEKASGSLTARATTLHHSDPNGKLLNSRAVDTSQSGLNMVSFGKTNSASMVVSGGLVAIVIGRTMHRSSDGLNHQGAIATLFDAESLQLVKNLGQTSGHSFQNFLYAGENQKFAALDLGDNYPRGVNFHTFNSARRDSRVVYSFKTEHSTSPGSKPFPQYTEISSGSKTYYKWSNDNKTYSELGGVIASADRYLIFFASEANPQGLALDNSRTGAYLVDSRNIGMVAIRKDIEAAKSSGNEVSDELVLSSGKKETGGFYTFGGTWSKQRNAGVVWLTSYRDKEKGNVSRLKAVRLQSGDSLLLWEKWTPSAYLDTYAMKVNAEGAPITEPISLGAQVRLGRTDDPLVIGNTVYVVSGDRGEQKLEIVSIESK